MQKIFENWKRYLLKEDFSQNNLDIILQAQDQFGEKLPDKFKEYGGIDLKHIKNFIATQKIFKTNKIIKMLGAGLYGFVFLLDNDHVLKIAYGGVNGLNKEVEKFKAIQTRQFNGTASKHEPAIYDFGTNGEVFYAEMGKVIPFQKWIQENHQNEKMWSKFLHRLGESFHFDDLDIKNIKNSREFIKLVSQFIIRDYHINLPPATVSSFLKSLFIYYKKTGNVEDIHDENFGVIPNKGEDIFVFFDV